MEKQGRNNKSITQLHDKRRSSAGKEFNIQNTQGGGNPIRLLATGFNMTIENLSSFIEKICAPVTNNIDATINDTEHLLEIIDNIKANEFLMTQFLFHLILLICSLTLTTLKVLRQ